jgi:hypothetical protein
VFLYFSNKSYFYLNLNLNYVTKNMLNKFFPAVIRNPNCIIYTRGSQPFCFCVPPKINCIPPGVQKYPKDHWFETSQVPQGDAFPRLGTPDLYLHSNFEYCFANFINFPSKMSRKINRSFLFSIQISQLARENYNERILNILHRLDFNGFYSKALDTFGTSINQF